jgi:DNA repair protein RecO (recombination protein O)
MNNFNDQGIILSLRAHGEAGAIVTLLTENHGKCGGYVNGAQSSKRLRSMLQVGNSVTCDWQSKAEGQLGRFNLELESDSVTAIFDEPKAIAALQSACGLLALFLPEHENYNALFSGTLALIDTLKTQEWPPVYILWEVAFLREMGYGIDLSACAVCKTQDKLTHISPKSGRAVCAEHAEPYREKLLEIPSFMRGEDLEKDDIEKGLKLTEYFLIHRLLQHSSYQTLPDARGQIL